MMPDRHGGLQVDRAAWLGQIADECMRTGVLPVLPLSSDVRNLQASLWPEPETEADFWNAREIRFNATFDNGDVIVTSRPWKPPDGHT